MNVLIHVNELGSGLETQRHESNVFLPSKSSQFNEIDLHKTMNKG